jgi:predicted transcriptional regulator
LWHHDVYKNHSTYPINYRVVTKDTKGTFASKDNGKHTKYYDFLTEDFRLYVDYGPEGYGTSRLESYNNSCSCNVVNPDLAPMVKDMLGFTNDLDESLRSYIKVNYPTEYELHYNKQTNTILANNINQSFFNWQSS